MEEKKDELYAFLNNQVNRALGIGGYANGYVALPPTHPFHNVDYSETDNYVHVHGGLTFGQCIDNIRCCESWNEWSECIGFDSFNEIPAGYWIVGFDTIHYGDEGLNRDWCIEETLRLKNQLEALAAKQPSTAAGEANAGAKAMQQPSTAAEGKGGEE